jgi:hypothetical protein
LTAGLVVAVLAAGCESYSSEMEGDCEERLVWQGHDWGGARGRPPLGARLGRTWTRGCGDERNERVTIYGVRGVDPSVAIAVQPRGTHRYLGLAPGYIVESPRHPLHRLLFGAHEPNEYADQICRRPRSVPARARTTPIYQGRPLRVAAERSADRRYLRGHNVDGVLAFDVRSVLDGVDRRGVPFVKAGDRLRLVLRACVYGPQAPDGLRGLHKLIVVRLERRGA